MMECPSRHQNYILKRISFRADTDLCSAQMSTLKTLQTKRKHTNQRWKNTPKPILATSIGHWLSPQIASTGTTLFMLSP